ncbi:unnamed protein product [Phytophthora lilii]|uniref:Unnamed protein product n=1 Tax=Phytophthora lilii TaxID=2077276 RepID=A0A9W6XJ08_9STRA|nr:unnamed protein product [Phytophthora lilii]
MEGENSRSCVTDVRLSSIATIAIDTSPDSATVQTPDAAVNCVKKALRDVFIQPPVYAAVRTKDASPAIIDKIEGLGGAGFVGGSAAALPTVGCFAAARCLVVAALLDPRSTPMLLDSCALLPMCHAWGCQLLHNWALLMLFSRSCRRAFPKFTCLNLNLQICNIFRPVGCIILAICHLVGRLQHSGKCAHHRPPVFAAGLVIVGSRHFCEERRDAVLAAQPSCISCST